MANKKRPLEVVIVGGSICGLSVAHGLLHAVPGCKITILEHTKEIKEAGAGLGLDRDTCAALADWGLGPGLEKASLPLDTEINRAVDPKSTSARVVYRDDHYDHRSCHWAQLHELLRTALPDGLLHLGRTMTSFEEIDGGQRVRVHVAEQDEPVEGDLLVSADGSMSSTREKLVGDKRRYSGYVAWRGVLTTDEDQAASTVGDASGTSSPSVSAKLRRHLQHEFPDLGRALYFDLAQKTHSVLYELPAGRINWLWYENQSEPPLKENSSTVKPDAQRIEAMREAAAQTWTPAMAAVMQATEKPFINAIFDRNPIYQFVYGRVVLAGEAAHPVTPHGLRSTNMSILDAHTFARSLKDHFAAGGSTQDLDAALDAFQKARIPAAAQEVLFSRYLGQVKQGLAHVPGVSEWAAADENQAAGLGQKNMRDFNPLD